MTAPAGSPLRQVHRELSFFHAHKSPHVGKDVLGPLSDSRLRATPRFLAFCRAHLAARGGEGDGAHG